MSLSGLMEGEGDDGVGGGAPFDATTTASAKVRVFR
jgi:hypothetical protein